MLHIMNDLLDTQLVVSYTVLLGDFLSDMGISRWFLYPKSLTEGSNYGKFVKQNDGVVYLYYHSIRLS